MKENKNSCDKEKKVCDEIKNAIQADKMEKGTSKEQAASDEEIKEEVDRINPDSETLDRG